MYKKELLYTKNICCSEGPDFRIEYYITVELEKFSDARSNYGILIEKTEKDKTEVYSANGCIASHQKAGRLLKKLSINTVTPVCAQEVIEVILCNDDC